MKAVAKPVQPLTPEEQRMLVDLTERNRIYTEHRYNQLLALCDQHLDRAGADQQARALRDNAEQFMHALAAYASPNWHYRDPS